MAWKPVRAGCATLVVATLLATGCESAPPLLSDSGVGREVPVPDAVDGLGRLLKVGAAFGIPVEMRQHALQHVALAGKLLCDRVTVFRQQLHAGCADRRRGTLRTG